MSTTVSAYHHGDLRAALVRAALELLEESGACGLSLRAVARRAGVAPSAPYRHYADRDALLSAVAAVGYRELAGYLAGAHPSPSTPTDLAAVAVAYVQFALRRPALFRVMFGEPCDRDSAERVAATDAITAYVAAIVRHAFPGRDPSALATAVWALVHGLAFLHLDGKLDASDQDAVAARVRAAVHALLGASAARSGSARPALELAYPPVLVIMGASGSGKSTVGALLASRLGWDFAEGDDLHPASNVAKMASGHPLDDADRWPWLRRVGTWITEQIEIGLPGIVTCSALKRSYRDLLRDPNVVFVYLGGTREQLVERLAERHGHFMPASLLDTQLDSLEPPDPDENAISVDISGTASAQCDEIVRRLRLTPAAPLAGK